MRVVFLGSQEIGARCLEVVLRSGHEVVGVGAFPPAEHEHWGDDVMRLVETHGLRRLEGRRFRTRRAIEELHNLGPEILFAIGWRWILPRAVLELPPKGCLGIHGSLLPRLRGFAPVNWALIRGETRTGPTLFYFDEGVDTGDIVGQRVLEITDADDAGTLRRRIAEAAALLLEEHLPALAAGTAPRIPQTGEATYGPRRRPEDGGIDWARSPREVFNWVRALTRPYPGAFTHLGEWKVHVWKVRPLEIRGEGPGVLTRSCEETVAVGAGSGAVELVEASLEGDSSPEAFRRVLDELRLRGGFSPTPASSAWGGPGGGAGPRP